MGRRVQNFRTITFLAVYNCISSAHNDFDAFFLVDITGTFRTLFLSILCVTYYPQILCIPDDVTSDSSFRELPLDFAEYFVGSVCYTVIDVCYISVYCFYDRKWSVEIRTHPPSSVHTTGMVQFFKKALSST